MVCRLPCLVEVELGVRLVHAFLHLELWQDLTARHHKDSLDLMDPILKGPQASICRDHRVQDPVLMAHMDPMALTHKVPMALIPMDLTCKDPTCRDLI